MAAARKRGRPKNVENLAECPFSVVIVDPNEKYKGPAKKKRRRTDGSEEVEAEKNKFPKQLSPFAHAGKFRTYENLDVHYQINPGPKWTEMTRYNSFVLNGIKYFSEGFIFVANDTSIERAKTGEPTEPLKKSDKDWVARILEIRASDEHHVYARIYWMYWPDDLPQGTHDGKKTVQGRQPYHGQNELIASNHMDIINVVSVTSSATVKQWVEENEEETQSSLYWRQAFDVRTYELSPVELVCSCNTPEQPDKLMIGCIAEGCSKWMHEECIIEKALKATYERLGIDKPHMPIEAVKKVKEEEEVKRPLSPTETGAGISTQPIDVNTHADAVFELNDNVEVKATDDDAPAAPEDQVREASTEVKQEAPPTKRKVGRPPKKKPIDTNGNSAKPWEGLFAAEVRTATAPPLVAIKDLRQGIVGGTKSWLEPLKCLICGTEVI